MPGTSPGRSAIANAMNPARIGTSILNAVDADEEHDAGEADLAEDLRRVGDRGVRVAVEACRR